MALWNTTDEAGSKPKFLSEADKAVTVGVDIGEAAANRAKGLRTPGWNKHTTYTDSQGNTRYKTECLVAGKSMTLDAEDIIAVNNLIKITTQPVAFTVVEGGNATFTVAATVTPSGTATYQWEIKGPSDSTWSPIALETAATLELTAVVLADDQTRFRCVVSEVNALTVTSKPALLTVTAA